MKGYYTANQIIDEALAGIRDFDRRSYGEAAMYFLRGYRDFALFHAGGQVKETWRSITAVNTVPYPEDLMRLLSVGINSDGEFFSFTRSDKIVSPVSNPLGDAFDTTRDEGDTLRRVPATGYGAMGQNVEYYYKDDRENRRVILSRMALDLIQFADRSEVLFRYVSNGVDDLDKTYITNDAANLLISYIEWKLVSARPEQYDARYRSEKKEEYIEAQRMYDVLELPSIDELEDVIYETSSQNVRR